MIDPHRTHFDASHDRYGSARFADLEMVRRAGMFDLHARRVALGLMNGTFLGTATQGGVLTVAGARSGKLTSALALNLLRPPSSSEAETPHHVMLDVKSEGAALSQLAVTMNNRRGIYWSPVKLPGVPVQHRINPVDYAVWGSPSLIDDIQSFAENSVVKSNAKNGNFFDGRGKSILEGLCVGITRRDGVLSLPAIHEAVGLLSAGGERWLDRIGFYMHQCQGTQYDDVAATEKFIHHAQSDATNETFQNFVGVLTNSFKCLSSPALRESVSPRPDGSYDYSFADLVQSEDVYSVFICVPQEYLQTWGAVVRSMFVAMRVYKSRNPATRPILAILDEAGNTGGPFPLAVELFTIGAGINIRPWVVLQSLSQANTLAEHGENIILSSAQTQQFFGVRDYPTADKLSKRLGVQTLRYGDEQAQIKARHAREQALHDLMDGADPIEAAMRARYHTDTIETPSVMQRLLRTPAELLNMPSDQQLLFTDHVGAPILCEKQPYFDLPAFAGTYLPNPYYPPSDRVQVMTGAGRRWLKVVTEAVPERYAHLPQHKDGTWTRLAT